MSNEELDAIISLSYRIGIPLTIIALTQLGRLIFDMIDRIKGEK